MNSFAQKPQVNSPSVSKSTPTSFQSQASSSETTAQRAVSQSPQVKANAILQTTLNQSPRVVAQTKLAQTLSERTTNSASKNTGVIQRQIIFQKGLEQNPGIIELKENPLFQRLNKLPDLIYIKIGSQSTEAVSARTHNKDVIDEHVSGTPFEDKPLDFVVNINPKTLIQEGTELDESRFFKRLGVSRYPLPILNPFIEEQPIPQEIPGRFDLPPEIPDLVDLPFPRLSHQQDLPDIPFTPSRRGLLFEPPELQWADLEQGTLPFTLPQQAPVINKPLTTILAETSAFLQSRQGKLSLYTTLLHELGHIEQSIKTPREFAARGKAFEEIRPEHVPPLPKDLIGRVEFAQKAGQLENPVWTELLDFKNTADKWLAVIKDVSNSTVAGLAEQAIDLGDDLAPYVQIWVEYDVITNIEHPAALERGESIRHTHGVEGTIGSAKVKRDARKKKLLSAFSSSEELTDFLPSEELTDKGPGSSILAELSLTNEINAPDSLPGVQQLMIHNAQRLTQPLVGLLVQYVEIYKQLAKL